MNPLFSSDRQTLIEGLERLQRVQVTRLFLQAVIPGISEPDHVCAAVRAQAMTAGFREDYPQLSQWLVHKIDGSQDGYSAAALGFARWAIDWVLLPRTVQARWLADAAQRMTRGAEA